MKYTVPAWCHLAGPAEKKFLFGPTIPRSFIQFVSASAGTHDLLSSKDVLCWLPKSYQRDRFRQACLGLVSAVQIASLVHHCNIQALVCLYAKASKWKRLVISRVESLLGIRH